MIHSIHGRQAVRAALRALGLLSLGAVGLAQEPHSFDNPRLFGAEELEQRIAAGEDFLPIIVNLAAPPAVKGFQDWQDPIGANQQREAVEALELGVLAQLPAGEFFLRHRLVNQACFSGLATLRGLERLLQLPLVESIEHDREVRRHTDQGITLMNGDAVRSQFNGAGSSIAIVDTGIDYNHPALGNGGFPNGKVIGGFDFGDNDSDPLDQNGHGTSAAGVAAGDVITSGNYVGGVAPGARLYALKIVAGGEGSAFNSDIAASWDWCVTNQNNDPSNPILVINTSFGGGQFSSACNGGGNSALATSATNAVNAGITLFVSSGNEGYCAAIATPACVSNAISVGAVYDSGIGSASFCVAPGSCVGTSTMGCTSGWSCTDATTAADQVTCYSNSAGILDILAPSNNATVPALGGGYGNFGGTSAASPYAAGAATVLLHAARTGGLILTPAEVRQLLIDTGDDILDAKSSITKPRVNMGDAVDGLGVWVDFAYSGTETGSILQPYNTLAEGVNNVPTGGRILIKSGSSSETPIIGTALTIMAPSGGVVIGS